MDRILRVASINLRSLVPKINEVRDFIVSVDLDVLAVCETWLSRSICSNLLAIRGYHLIRQDRDGNVRGGGVCFFIRDKLNHKILATSKTIEQLWISLKLGDMNIALGIAYKPPNTNYKYFCDELETWCTYCSLQSDKTICMGDVNINLLNESSVECNYFNAMCEDVGMFQLVSVPTRIAASSSTLIDVILSSDPNLITEVGGWDVSDHELVSCFVNIPPVSCQPTTITYRCYNNFNFENFTADLQSIPFNYIFRMTDVNCKIDYLTDELNRLLNEHLPLRTATVRHPRPPWLTSNIRLMMTLRDKAKQRFRRTKKNAHWVYYKMLRNYTTAAINREKKAYLETKMKNAGTKTIYKELRNLSVIQKKHYNLPENLTDPQLINNHFSQMTADSGESPASDGAFLFLDIDHVVLPGLMNFIVVEESIIEKYLSQIQTTSSDFDGLNINLIKLCCPIILPYLTHIVNSCLLECIFPRRWKTAVCVPIPKCTQPKQIEDLRLISLLPVFSKILEKVMSAQLREHLTTNNLLPLRQSGFRPAHSCTTALLDITDDILSATDRGEVTVMILLDFSKAFDTVDHETLLAVLPRFGLSESALSLISSFLDERVQYVRVGSQVSNCKAVKRGVPQGSILGPLLFTIYTSVIPDFIQSCKIHMYADDTQLYKSFGLQDRQAALHDIQNDLTSLADISVKLSLSINPVKSKVILFGPANDTNSLSNEVRLHVAGAFIPVCEEAGNLGLIMDNTFRYKKQITKYIQRSYANIKLLYPHRHYLSPSLKTHLCDSLVLSTFNYCCEVYGTCITQDTSARIQRVQNSCLRLIYGIRKFQHISHKLNEVGWLNMANRRKLLITCMYHKIIISKKPPYLYYKIRFREDVHNLNIRHKYTITPPYHKTALFERSFSYCVAKYYNSITTVHKSRPCESFKVILRKELLQSQMF